MLDQILTPAVLHRIMLVEAITKVTVIIHSNPIRPVLQVLEVTLVKLQKEVPLLLMNNLKPLKTWKVPVR